MIELQLVSQQPAINKMWVVVRDGVSLGLITKIPNDSTTVNPWKAFLGLGWGQSFLGSFYGGQGVAIQAVVNAADAAKKPDPVEELAAMWATKPIDA